MDIRIYNNFIMLFIQHTNYKHKSSRPQKNPKFVGTQPPNHCFNPLALYRPNGSEIDKGLSNLCICDEDFYYLDQCLFFYYSKMKNNEIVLFDFSMAHQTCWSDLDIVEMNNTYINRRNVVKLLRTIKYRSQLGTSSCRFKLIVL